MGVEYETRIYSQLAINSEIPSRKATHIGGLLDAGGAEELLMTLGGRITSAGDVATLMAKVPHPDAPVVPTPGSHVVPPLLRSSCVLGAGISKLVWEPLPQQRTQSRQAASEDGEVGFGRSIGRPPGVHETARGRLPILLCEYAEPHDSKSRDSAGGRP